MAEVEQLTPAAVVFVADDVGTLHLYTGCNEINIEFPGLDIGKREIHAGEELVFRELPKA